MSVCVCLSAKFTHDLTQTNRLALSYGATVTISCSQTKVQQHQGTREENEQVTTPLARTRQNVIADNNKYILFTAKPSFKPNRRESAPLKTRNQHSMADGQQNNCRKIWKRNR